MIALYAIAIIFTILLVIAAIAFITTIYKKKADHTFYFLMIPMLLFFAVIAFIFSTDVAAHIQGNGKHAAGSCETTFVRGGKSLDTTEVVIGNKTYLIKSDTYKHLKDGYHECELTYAPITKFVLEANIK